MANECFVTGKKCSFGNSVSHANNHNRRKYSANIRKHKVFIPALKQYICVKVSAKGLRNIAKLGI